MDLITDSLRGLEKNSCGCSMLRRSAARTWVSMLDGLCAHVRVALRCSEWGNPKKWFVARTKVFGSENSCGCSMPADRSRDRPVCLLDGVCEQVPRSSGAHCPHFQTVINAIFFQSMLPMVQILFFPHVSSCTLPGPHATRALLN